MSYNNSFRDSGLPRQVAWKSKTGAGQVIASPGADKHILIYDILASDDTILKNGSGGTNWYIYAPAGSTNLTGGMKLEANQEVYSTAGNVTITYAIV
jgi:hypothetical protein